MADDVSELRQLAVDLDRLGATLNREAKQVAKRGAVNIKKQLRAEAKTSKHFRIARRINFDIREEPGLYEVEVGPETGSTGSLAGIAYFGGVHGGGNTIPDPQGALDAEAPNVEKYLLEVAAKALL